MHAKSLQSCPILCDPIDGSPPGSPIPGILQARTLEWVAIAFFTAPATSQLQSELPTRDFAFAFWHCSGVAPWIMGCLMRDCKSQGPGTVSFPFLGLGTEDTLKNQLECC